MEHTAGWLQAGGGVSLYRVYLYTYIIIQSILIHVYHYTEHIYTRISLYRAYLYTYIIIQSILIHIYYYTEHIYTRISLYRVYLYTYIIIQSIFIHVYHYTEYIYTHILLYRVYLYTYIIIQSICIYHVGTPLAWSLSIVTVFLFQSSNLSCRGTASSSSKELQTNHIYNDRVVRERVDIVYIMIE